MKLKNQTLLHLVSIILSFSVSSAFRPSLEDNDQFKSLPITKDSFGSHYISVNWGKLFANATTQDPSISTGKMTLNLYSNETFVARCPSFRVYPDNRYDHFIQSTQPRQLNLLYKDMQVTGHPIRLDIKTSAFYAINSPALFATECSRAFKGDVHGYIGLGSNDNFLTAIAKNFAVFLSDGKDGLNSSLYIGNKSHISGLHSKKKGFTSTVQTGKNWAMSMSDMKVEIGDSYSANLNLTKKYNVIFDLNTETIGVPLHLYKFITKILEGFNLFCSDSAQGATCHSKNADLDNLPTFGLVMDGNTASENVIPLTPELYFDKEHKVLLLKSLSSENFTALTVNSDYSDSVVLGASFMQHYYVQFEEGRDSSMVTIQEAEHQPGPDRSYVIMVVIIILVSYVLIMVLGFVIYLFKFKEDDPVPEKVQTQETKEGEIALKITSPLLAKKGDEEMAVKDVKKTFNEMRRTACNSIAE